MTKMVDYDFFIIGAGIVGLATAYEITQRFPTAKVLILEKEKIAGLHQTGRNSGVIHAGIYYQPGSLKALLCKQGLELTKLFCIQHNIPYNECGKLIVATSELESERLNNLYERGTTNGLRLTRVSSSELHTIEPNITGREAVLCKDTAIVDYSKILSKLVDILSSRSVSFSYNQNILAINEKSSFVEIITSTDKFYATNLIACAGIQSDRIARLSGINPNFSIVPFRGEYFILPERSSSLINHLIYPVPDPKVPFLGIHLTRTIDGRITIGPNAVLGFSREGYDKFSISLKDTFDIASFPGFWKLLYKYRDHAAHELINSISNKVYLDDCKKYCPSLSLDMLLPYRTGIRAQVVLNSGELSHDFMFEKTSRMLHVCNAPSPAATSAFPIGRLVVDKLFES